MNQGQETFWLLPLASMSEPHSLHNLLDAFHRLRSYQGQEQAHWRTSFPVFHSLCSVAILSPGENPAFSCQKVFWKWGEVLN